MITLSTHAYQHFARLAQTLLLPALGELANSHAMHATMIRKEGIAVPL